MCNCKSSPTPHIIGGRSIFENYTISRNGNTSYDGRQLWENLHRRPVSITQRIDKCRDKVHRRLDL